MKFVSSYSIVRPSPKDMVAVQDKILSHLGYRLLNFVGDNKLQEVTFRLHTEWRDVAGGDYVASVFTAEVELVVASILDFLPEEGGGHPHPHPLPPYTGTEGGDTPIGAGG
jgi:hypothetical protein